MRQKCFTILLFVSLSTLLPLYAHCQEEDQQEEELPSDPINTGTNGPVIGSSTPWSNGTQTTQGATSSPSTGTTTQRNTLGRPARTLGHEPPGNPDVPFDDNMNLAFLVTGLVFSFWVIRKRFYKATVVSTK